jgi:hypothetical protein
MSNELVKHEQSFDVALQELENVQMMTEKLFKMKHYQKLGDAGIFAIIQKAKSIGLNPLDALNGGAYFVNGKVELSANTMNYLIRAAGHSITKCKTSTKDNCVLIGKRKDNGDTFTCSFSIQDAKTAGIYKNVWQTYPEDMLFARALTRLARQLFPDVCKGCYVEGEIPTKETMEMATYEEVKPIEQIEYVKPIEYITAEQKAEIEAIKLECDPKRIEKIDAWLKQKCNGEGLDKLKAECFRNTMEKLLDAKADYLAKKIDAVMSGEEVQDGSA